MENRLSPLQREVLGVLRPLTPNAVLTDGAALVGYYLGHRETRDLDVFFRERPSFGTEPQEVEGRLRAAGLDVRVAQTAPSFRRLEVRREQEVVELDLVAEPFAALAPPREVEAGLWADSPHEILVNKLNALLGRSAIRDLFDVRALVASGLDLDAALRDAAKRDGGFSPPTLAWILDALPVRKLAADAGFDPDALAVWRDVLRQRLLEVD